MNVLERAYSIWERFCKKPLALFVDASFGDGFRIVVQEEGYQITAGSGQEALHGVMELIRLCRLGKSPVAPVEERARFSMRMLWSWSRIESTYRHSPYWKYPSMLRPELMEDPENQPEMQRFLRHAASMGVNALTLMHELHHSDLGDYDQHLYRQYYDVLERFAVYLQSWGIELFLYAGFKPDPIFCREVADSDCAFDPRVRQFTEDYIEEFCRAMPHIGGVMVRGALGQFQQDGSIRDCRCTYCREKSVVQRAEEQIKLLSSALARHGKRLVYTVTIDIPFMLERETDTVLSLAGRLPENAYVTFKNIYHDYEDLRYPENPLFPRLEQERSDCRQLGGELQLFPEMRGKGFILSNVAAQWRRDTDRMAALHMRCIIGVTETHPDDRHPSMADWYVFGRLCYDAHTPARELLVEWASLEYPPQAAQEIAGILLESYAAAADTVYAGGLQCGIHGMLAEQPRYIKHKMNDTWCRQERPLPHGVLGVEDEPLWLYPPARARQLYEDPRLLLFCHAFRVEPWLKEVLLSEKEAAVRRYEGMLQRFEALKGCFEPGDYRYTQLRRMLAQSAEDARRFRAYLEIFLDYQMGALTQQQLDAAHRSLIGTGADCSIHTCDEAMVLFLERMGHLLRGEKFDEHYDNMRDQPQCTGKIWQEGRFEEGEA